MRRDILAKRAAFFAGIIIIWQVAADAEFWPDEIFPSPYEVAQDLAYGALDGSLLYGTATSMARLLVALAVAIAGGIVLGILMARVDTINQTAGSLVLGLQSIPSIAWVPLAFVWFGVSDAGILFVTAIGAIFAVTLSTSTGVRNIDPHYLEAARNMGAGGSRLVIHVLVPAAFPYMITGFKQGWAFAWRGLIGAEILFSYLGLGFLLNVGRQTIDVSQIIAIMIVVMGIGMLVDGVVFRRLEDRVMSRWGLR